MQVGYKEVIDYIIFEVDKRKDAQINSQALTSYAK